MRQNRILAVLSAALLLCGMLIGCGAQQPAQSASAQNTPVQANGAAAAAPEEGAKSYQLVGKYEEDSENAARLNAAFLMNLHPDGTVTVDRYRFSEYDASDAATNPTYEASYLSGTWKAVEKDGIPSLQIKLAYVNADGTTANDQTIYATESAGEYSVEMTFPIVPGMSYTRVAEMRGGEEKIYTDADEFLQAFRKENPNGESAAPAAEAPVVETDASAAVVLVLSGEVDPKRAGVGMGEATVTLYEGGAYEGFFSTKFGGAVFSAGSWVSEGDGYLLTESTGSEIPVSRNADGVLAMRGVWSVGSLTNMDFVLTESDGSEREDDVVAVVEAPELPLVYTEPIAVTGGSIRGALNADGTVASYKGIPYAAAPIGELRWKEAAPVVPWDGVKDCDGFTANPINFVTVNRTGFDAEFGIDSKLPMTEDSLFVNVWTQTNSEKAKPVIFFIPGGGFTTGGASCPLYDGESLAKKGVVFVTVNYRLGSLGFMAHPELTAASVYNGSGNYAVSDVIAALRWVQDNIALFGGDPGNVTVMGQSAGSRMTHALVASPKASGLFRKAFTASADIMNRNVYTQEESEAQTAEAFGNASLAELRSMDGEALVTQYGANVRLTLDGEYLPEMPSAAYADGSANRVTFVMGLVNGDVTEPTVNSAAEYEAAVRETFGDAADALLAIYPATDDTAAETARRVWEDAALMRLQYQARAYAIGSDTGSYVYYMTHPYPEKNTPVLAQHTQDLPYWFDHLAPVRDPYLTDFDRELAAKMSDMLVAFAKSGTPSADWTASSGTGEYLLIGDTVETAAVPKAAQAVWNEYYRSVFGF